MSGDAIGDVANLSIKGLLYRRTVVLIMIYNIRLSVGGSNGS